MPLVRFQVRNEYGLGDSGLYKGAAKEEDSKAVLDGIAVAGLVGILRQLGDLAEFASDVFHDLHEQLIATAAKGRKVLNRVQNIETALPSIEKAVQGQTSHIHLAYVAGSNWHAYLSMEKNHILSSELPRYMMDLYEECRDLPRLYLLDKFDSAGAGACPKRYSDPSYFRKMSVISRMEKAENIQREKQTQKYKKIGSRLRYGELRRALSAFEDRNGEFQHVPSTSLQNSRQSLFENRSPPDMRSNPELPSRSTSFGSKSRSSFVDQIIDTNPSAMPDEIGYLRFSDFKPHDKLSNALTSLSNDEFIGDGSNYGFKHDSLEGQIVPKSPSATWVEKTEIIMPTSLVPRDDIVVDTAEDSASTNLPSLTSTIYGKLENSGKKRILLNSSVVPVSLKVLTNPDEVASEPDNYMDASSTLESEIETEAECRTKREVEYPPDSSHQGIQPVNATQQALIVEHPEPSDAEALNASHTPLDQHESPDLCSSALTDVSKDNAHGDSRKNADNGLIFNPSFESFTSDVQIMLGDETGIEASTAFHSPSSDPRNASSVPSTKLWTNAGLFGLAPSKPPDLGPLNVVEEHMTFGFKECYDPSNSDNVDLHQNSPDICGERDERNSNSTSKTGLSADLSRVRQANQIQPNDDMHGKPNLLSELDDPQVKPANSIHDYLSRADSTRNNDVYMASDSSVPSNIEPLSNDLGQSTMNISSSFSILAQRFLANTLQRKASISYIDSLASSQAVDSNTRESDRSFSLGKCDSKMSTSTSNHCSKQSSPPLECMKISFNPINTSEIPKLMVEFSDGNLLGNADDLLFPASQLLPGTALPLPDSASESDDDTFCRSYNYSSEDLPSPHLYSNSEPWDHEERIFEERGLCDDSHQISPFEQAEISVGNIDVEGTEVPFETFAAVDLPAFDSLMTMENQEIGDCNTYNPVSSTLGNQIQMPPLPPLPPLQWRMMKSSTVSGEDSTTKSKDSVIPSNGVQPLCFTQQQVQVPISPPVHESLLPLHINKLEMLNTNKDAHHSSIGLEMTVREELLQHTRNKSDWAKMNGPEEPRKGSIDTNTLDEGEELFHQIRNKAFEGGDDHDN